jgi:ribosome-binding protein aMBF1 (putative translation factor)
MNKCYLCGVSESETFLYEGISKKGVVFVCRKCYFKNKIPLIHKKEVDWSLVDKGSSVRERLAKMAKVELKPEKISRFQKNPEDVTLSDIVERNLKKELPSEKVEAPDLIDNFHWIIMRKRRALKMSREEFAKAIFESPVLAQSIEEGILPKNYGPLIKKIESSLGVRLFKNNPPSIAPEHIISESKVPSGILISDLKEASGEIHPETLDLNKVREVVGSLEEDQEPSMNKPLKELSEEELKGLVWGKKRDLS